MAGSLGRAYVEVHADTKPFRRELKEGVDAALAEQDAKVKVAAEKTGGDYSDGFETGRKKRWSRVKKGVEKDLKDTEKVAKTVAEDAGKAVAGGFKLAEDAADEFGTVAAGAAEDVEQGLSLIERLAKSVASGMGNIGSAITGLVADAVDLPALAITLALIVALMIPLSIVIGGLIGALLALVAIIGQVVAALTLVMLPALLGILAVVGPLVGAFLALGKVFALVTEDQKSFNSDAKSLDPTLRGIATSLRAVYQFLLAIGESYILKPLLDVFDSMRKTLGPVLKSGMIAIAKAWGQFFVAIAKVLGTKASLHDLSVIFANMAAAIVRMAPVAAKFFQALLDFAASPAVVKFLNDLLNLFGVLITEFSVWLEKVSKDGSLNTFFADALVTIKKVFDLIGAIGNLMGSLITPETVNNSGTLLDNITGMINTLANFFRSPEGQKWISKMMSSTEKLLIFVGAFTDVFGTILSFFIGLGTTITMVVEGMVDFLIGAMNVVIDGINLAIDAADLLGAGISEIPHIPYIGQSGGGDQPAHPKNPTGLQGGIAKHFKPPGAGAAGRTAVGVLKGLKFFEHGGMTGDQSVLGALHPHEVVIPLTKPARAMALAQQSGLLDMVGGRSMVHVIVMLDGAPFYSYTERAIDAVGNALSLQPRMAGVG